MSSTEDDLEDVGPSAMTRPIISVTITPRPFTTAGPRKKSKAPSRPRTVSGDEAKMASKMAKNRNGQQQIMELFKMKNRTPMPAICKDPVPVCGQKVYFQQQPGTNCASPVPSITNLKSGQRPGARHLSLDIDLRNSKAHCRCYRIDDRLKQKVLVIKDSEILEDPMPEYQLPKHRNQLSDPFVRKRIYPQKMKAPDVQFSGGMRHVREKLRNNVAFPEKTITSRHAWTETFEKDVTSRHGKHKIVVYYNKTESPEQMAGNPRLQLGRDKVAVYSDVQSGSARPLDGCLYSCLKDSIHSLKHGTNDCEGKSSGTRRRQSTPVLSASLKPHGQRGKKRIKSACSVSPEQE